MPEGPTLTIALDHRIDRPAAADETEDRGPFGRLTPFEAAVVETVAYADVFDWPLTPAEIHRFLPIAGRLDEVESALASPRLHGRLSAPRGLVSLAGRESLVPQRHRRAATSARMWPRAVRWARVVASLPFVRLVGVTGSLAVGAADGGADVDLFIVTEDRRLWVARVLAIGVVRIAAAGGVRLCPNYIVSESALELAERDIFTAHELLQMVPISGSGVYGDLLARNRWYRSLLPNHPGTSMRSRTTQSRTGAGSLVAPALGAGLTALRTAAESVLRRPAFDRLERWEMRRKVARLSAGPTSAEVRFDESVCRGHVDEHRHRTLARFRERLARLNEAVA